MALMAFLLVPAGLADRVDASGPNVPSAVSVFLTCPSNISFAMPAESGLCGSGNYTGIYSGISQTVVSNQSAAFYLAGDFVGVKVTFGLTDLTTGKLLLNGVGYGSMENGTCSTPTRVVPVSTTVSNYTINSGDTLRAFLNTTFTGTGTPTFCSGGGSPTHFSIGTMVVIGSVQPYLTTTLKAGAPSQTTLSGFPGVAISYFDSGSAGFSAVVVGVVKTSSGSTIDVLITSVTVSPGATTTAFLKLNQYPSGTYEVTVLAVTGSNVPVSTPAVTAVSV
jgi:hypothetical protein